MATRNTQLDHEYDGEPWENQGWETAKAYGAFTIYLNMPGETRSLQAVADQLGYRSDRYVKEWSRRYEWQGRLDAYLVHLHNLARQRREEEHALELQEFIETQKRMAKILHGTAVEALRIAGKGLKNLTEEDIQKMGPTAIASFLRTAAGVAETSANAHAQAIGVEELLHVLTDE